EFREEHVEFSTDEPRLEGAGGRRKLIEPSATGDVSVSRGVDLYGIARGDDRLRGLRLSSAEIGRVEQRLAIGAQLADEGVGHGKRWFLGDWPDEREVGRGCAARHVGLTGSIHGDRQGNIVPETATQPLRTPSLAPQIGRVYEPGPVRSQLRHERVVRAST